ncbi:MAG: CheR family methyltransferase [Pseudomonadota bacterium]
MRPDDFAYLSKILHERTGLVLGSDKTYLVESRLSPLIGKWNIAGGLDGIVPVLRNAGKDSEILAGVIDAMMTNESLFFRDIKPFEQFRQVVLRYLREARRARKAIRIWSAACSTGQEPYTLAMIFKEESAAFADWKIDIVGTDISREALARARAGAYTQFEAQRGLPIQMLMKHFKQHGDKWQIAPDIRSMVQFRDFNLLADPTPLGVFDVIFCRNVLIYFDQPTKAGVLERIARLLPPDGFLYLGGAETVLGVSDRFAPMPGQRGIYGLALRAVRRAANA